ncbi:MAG: hypothetical protein K9M98_12615 [Cephaloticoccus sp.]|nr:hypothetical protein [Cephaloticoccus sp.]MCF7761335.1 hypothetical protein [Cephaloticoccus sp.]
MGTQADTYGLGTFYLDSGMDGVRWRLNREAGWLWEMEVAGSINPAMHLDATNKLVLYASGVAGVTMDPASPSLSLGDSVLYRSPNGNLKTDRRLLAANLSGNNTGDQSRADLNLARTDNVTFGRVKAGAALPTDLAFVADDLGSDERDFAIFADGKQKWGTGADDRDTNLYRSAAGILKTDGALVVGSESESVSPETGALTVVGGVGVLGTLNVAGDISAPGISTGALLLANSTGAAEPVVDIRFANAEGFSLASLAGIPDTETSDQGDLSLATREGGGELSEKVRITGNGNVGIGTSSPDFKLDVAGELRVAGTTPSVMKGPLLLVPQGDLPMGEFTAGPNPSAF